MTTVALVPTPRLQFTDINGAPLVGGTVATYVPTTFTPATTWQDSLGTVPNANPLTLDALGSASIWGSGSYRMIVSDALGNLIFDATTTAPALSTGVLLAANNLSDVADIPTSRTNLGLGTAATQNTGTSGATVPLLSAANTWTLAQTFSATAVLSAGANLTPGAAPSTSAVGYLGVPQNTQTTNYVLAMGDAGGEVFCSASINVTIPPAATVAFPRGTIVQITADASFTGTVVQGSGVTLRNPTGNATGNRTITGPGFITVKLEKSNEWWICGGVNFA